MVLRMGPGLDCDTLGDLTGDGCEEFAIGELGVEPMVKQPPGRFGYSMVRGEGCLPSNCDRFSQRLALAVYSALTWRISVARKRAGTLVIGAPETRRAQNNQRTGAIWLVDLERIGTAETPNMETLTIQLVDSENDRIIEGRVNEGRFGYQVASDDEFVFASELFGRHGEATRIGGVFAYDVSNNRLRRSRALWEALTAMTALATASVSEARHAVS